MRPTDYLPLARSSFHRVRPHISIFHSRSLLWVLLFILLCALIFIAEHTSDDSENDAINSSPAVARDHHSLYIPFYPSSKPPNPSATTLLNVHELPLQCLDNHLSLGELCYDMVIPPMDVVWTWVNGSDALLQQTKDEVQSQYAANDPYRPSSSTTQGRQFRDHDELRHSIRSVLENFRSYTDHFHLITADFAIPESSSNHTFPSTWRLGQMPQWLDVAQRTDAVWQDGNVKLSLTHHAEIFRPYERNNFNSYAIESQFGNLPDVTETFIYMNDDFFIASAITPMSFYTSTYGLVVRMQPDLMVGAERPTNARGEWRSMGETNWLLSTRFGVRARPYVIHEAKAASLALISEISSMWTAKVAQTAQHSFRETEGGEGDINMMFMLAHFTVERWREALLWAWVVAKHGGSDDSWGMRTATAWRELGGAEDKDDLVVKSARRETLQKERVAENLRKSGHKGEMMTTYSFSSLDGYPFTGMTFAGRHHWPAYSTAASETCHMSRKQCFGNLDDTSLTASEVFKNMAFRYPACGDCAIMALVEASGTLGLSAFLPARDRALGTLAGKVPAHEHDIPHLPLVDNWTQADFSLRAVMGLSDEINVRVWTLRLLQRYRFVIGDTPSMFERISGPGSASTVTRKIDRTPDVVLLCINDDVSAQDDRVVQILKDWQNRKWGTPAAWEH